MDESLGRDGARVTAARALKVALRRTGRNPHAYPSLRRFRGCAGRSIVRSSRSHASRAACVPRDTGVDLTALTRTNPTPSSWGVTAPRSTAWVQPRPAPRTRRPGRRRSHAASARLSHPWNRVEIW